MKNNQKIIAAVVLAIVAGFILWWACNNGGKENEMVKEENGDSTKMMLEMELIAYSHAEMNFIRLTAEEVNAKIEEEIPFFLYTGRATCQWCRKMVPVLNKVIKEDNIELFYLDSENTEVDEVLSDFRDKFGIKTVPSIIYFMGSENYYTFELNVTENDEDEIEINLKEQFEAAVKE